MWLACREVWRAPRAEGSGDCVSMDEGSVYVWSVEWLWSRVGP
jgi:hypothetical protein